MSQKLSASRISPEPITLDVLNSGLSTKQNKLTAGEGIQIKDDTISSTVNSAEWGNITGDINTQTDLIEKLSQSGGSGKADNITITKNSNDELQTEGCLNQLNNSTPIKFWSGTKAEYDALESYSDDVIYNVDEDSSTIHSGDNETITGIKTFDGQDTRQSVTITNDLVDINSESESSTFSSIFFSDKKTDKILGSVNEVTNRYRAGIYMCCENPYNLTPSETIKQESLYPHLGVYSYPDGSYSSVAPEPSIDSNDQNIATTSFVNKVADKKIENELQSSLWNYTTNRILEIPQNVKYATELVEEGKKRYRLKILKNTTYFVPSGFEDDGVTPKFSIRTTINDNYVEDNFWSDNSSLVEMVFLCFKDNTVTFKSQARIGSNVYSGETAPTSFLEKVALWYDTKNNYVKYTNDSGTNWYNASLPLLIGSPLNTVSETQPIAGWVNSATQVFNGFGFIGSCTFILPGIKIQIPDGFNNDGTLKSKIVTHDELTIDNSSINITTISVGEGSLWRRNSYYSDSYTEPTTNYTLWYDRNTNLMKDKETESFSRLDVIPFYSVRRVNGQVVEAHLIGNTEITQSNSFVSGLSFPSSKIIQLTLGASGTKYIAPANGWFVCDYVVSKLGSWIVLECKASQSKVIGRTSVTNQEVCALLPIKAGDEMLLGLDSSATYTKESYTNGFSFIYAQGEQ